MNLLMPMVSIIIGGIIAGIGITFVKGFFKETLVKKANSWQGFCLALLGFFWILVGATIFWGGIAVGYMEYYHD